MKYKFRVNIKVLLLLLLLIVGVASFTAPPIQSSFIEHQNGSDHFNYEKFLDWINSHITNGGLRLIDILMPIFLGLVSINLLLEYVKAKEFWDFLETLFSKLLAYICIYFFLINWFGGLNLSKSIVKIITYDLPTLMLKDYAVSVTVIVDKIFATLGNVMSYIGGKALLLLIQKFDIGGMAVYLLTCNILVLMTGVLILSAIGLVFEIFCETMNIYVIVYFSVIMFVVGLVKGFEEKLFNPLQHIINCLVKFLIVNFFMGVVWKYVSPYLTTLDKYNENSSILYSIEVFFEIFITALIFIFSYIVYKLCMNAIGNSLQRNLA